MSNEEKNQFKVHSIVGVQPSVSLTKIGTLSSTQLSTVSASFTDCSPIGWEARAVAIDIKFADDFKFDLKACIDDEDFVLFGFTKDDEKKSQLQTLFELYPETAHEFFGVLTCDSYFAHIHNDQEVVKSAGQIMFVVENNAEHLLYSKDQNGVEHTLVPQKGDVILLDVWCDHAVIPNQSNGIEFMKENGMKLVCFALD
jgi:hypothetical protein